MNASRWQSSPRLTWPARVCATTGIRRKTTTFATTNAMVTHGVRRGGFTSWIGITHPVYPEVPSPTPATSAAASVQGGVHLLDLGSPHDRRFGTETPLF